MTNTKNTTKDIKKSKPQRKPILWSAQRFFLTFPKIDQFEGFGDYIDKIHSRFPNELRSAIIARESHSDGSLHLHFLLIFNIKKITSNPAYFDFICNKHGHYETIRDLDKCLTYIKKR